MAVDLERLKPGAQVRFRGRPEVVSLIAVSPGPYWEFVYKAASGLGGLTLAESELDGIEIVEQRTELLFDGDPNEFRLGIEAHRIQIAFAYEMAALAVSNVQPLPHQLEAVYDHFLREPRLRYLLADDPGAGKTIMAGLYMKELILRRAGDRILIVTPANLRPQWARELADRFQLNFQQLEAVHFDASATENPWDLYDRIIVSRDFLRTERALEAFESSQRDWDLAVIDEAHGFTAYVDGKGFINRKSQRYQAAEVVSRRSHRLVLMTATPHKGDDGSFWALLRLLDLDAFGDRCPKKVEIPPRTFRKVPKEEMKDMSGNDLFKPRHPQTVAYELEGAEWDLYEAVTDFVSTKLAAIRGDSGRTTAGFALTTMQRRVASSVRAIRRTLERRIERIEKALADPEEYLKKKKVFQTSVLPEGEDIEDYDEEDLWKLEEKALEEWLPDTIAELEAEREALGPLLSLAEEVEGKRVERKLTELLDVVQTQGLKEDRRKQLLIFTEHKDTLEYLVENLQKDFEVAVIHGGLKLADRIAQERYFREKAQIMVATEAAGEGINLQFCHLMVNYDIPWNPNRLEQRMGRIHRIGQTEDVYIFNLVASNTREGYVLKILLDKMVRMGYLLGDKVFDVIGGTFAGYKLRDLLEAVLAREITREEAAERLGGSEADPASLARAQELLQDALAQHHLDWQMERARHARAEERRLPPSYFERFLTDAIAFAGGRVSKRLDGTLRVERTPDILVAQSRTAGATRQIASTYERLTFDKSLALKPRLEDEAALPQAELCGPGHPLFDALVDFVIQRTQSAVAKGAVFFDPDATEPSVIRMLVSDVIDGNGEVVRRSLTSARVTREGGFERAPSRPLFDYVPTTEEVRPASNEVTTAISPDAPELVMWSRQHLFEDVYQETAEERTRVASIQEDFLRRSFNALLAQAETALIAGEEEVERGVSGAEGRLRKVELTKAQHELRRRQRLEEAERTRTVNRGPVVVVGGMLLLPLPRDGEVQKPVGKPRQTDDEIERIAVDVSMRYERKERHADCISVEADNVGFDLLSTRSLERRCIEVKGRAGVARVELTWSEFAKSQELGDDYWLYVVLDCGTPSPRLYRVQNPAQTLAGAWRPSLDVRYRVDPEPVIDAAEGGIDE